MNPIHHERLLDLVGKIYDCVVDPSSWLAVVEEFRQVFRLHNTVLAANSLDGRSGTYQVVLGIPETYLRMVHDPAYEAAALDLWGGPSRLAVAPLEEPLVQSESTPTADWRDNIYFRDFSVPQGIIDAVAIGLVRDRTMVANIAGGRHASEGPVLPEEVDGLRMLAPHLRRAVTIAGLFEDARSMQQTFLAALETLSAGLVLVDADMKIVHANKPASDMLAQGDPILSRAGRLSLRQEVAPGALAAAVNTSLPRGPADVRSGIGIPARRVNGEPMLVHVLPLDDGVLRQGLALRATAALFIAPAPGPLHLPGDAISALFGLTPAELRVMELIVEGFTNAEAAERLGTAQSTTKTHLQRVFQKTGAHSRDDLVRLAMSTAKPA